VIGADDGEITAVKGGDALNIQAFRYCDNRRFSLASRTISFTRIDRSSSSLGIIPRILSRLSRFRGLYRRHHADCGGGSDDNEMICILNKNPTFDFIEIYRTSVILPTS